ncbi:ABC transporter ATP-binding protein [Rhodococcus sp. 15-649-2-2]|uniref:ABC transporter ATP-binding protein n=1 Tax=Rhodococcus sp. 15-649-2-2 TaxID=2023140 RepID=UPI000B9BE13D|nr:ABC transporter ATP-binding protein [Rhodococcus sp. 15-649-2-2]OZE74624.1 ABC transporter ATP-binding protein [Rhodococcus sp. 15-649-2-2]
MSVHTLGSIGEPGTIAASATHLTKKFGTFTAVDDVSFEIERNKIYGFLGRNGAGKTTVMQMMTAQMRQSAGEVSVLGQRPWENPHALSHVCFVKESQKYPDDLKVKNAISQASHILPHWDDDFAAELLRDFDLPVGRKIKKLSRGMTSALGIVIGLASRAPLTFFDEPYLGLDAVSRHMFYDRLLADYAENPRTVILSTHLIDEVSDLIEHVILIDKGRIVLDADSDALREGAFEITGPAKAVDSFISGHRTLHRTSLGASARATIDGRLTDRQKSDGAAAGLTIEAIPLQQLIIERTNVASEEAAS